MPSNHDHCCVPGCTADRRYPPGDRIRLFHKFPENLDLRKKWIDAIRRDEVEGVFSVKDSTVVYCDHFLAENYVQKEKVKGARHVVGTVPSVFDLESWPKYARTTAVEAAKTPRRSVVRAKTHCQTETPNAVEHTAATLEEAFDQMRDDLARCEEELASIRQNSFGLNRFKSSPQKMTFYTGFDSYESFAVCAKFLDLEEETSVLSHRSKGDSERARAVGGGRRTALSLTEWFFMTLVRLRRGIDEAMLADLYFVSLSTVSRVLHHMINYLYLRLGSIPIWPTVDSVKKHMPQAFTDLYPNTLLVMDATEVKCEVASSLPLQTQLYSAYKSHTTLKGLLAMTPDGAVAFVSQLYCGWISDREIVLRSGFLDLLKSSPPGLSIMADKGFDIQDLLVDSGMKLNIPPFKTAGQQMSATDVVKIQQIAKLRIHVERLIQRIKEFRILSGVIPLTLFPVINQVWTICCLLTLFHTPIIAKPSVEDPNIPAKAK